MISAATTPRFNGDTTGKEKLRDWEPTRTPQESTTFMEQLPPFQTELYFTEFEFSAPHLLSCSDCQTLTIGELLKLAPGGLELMLDQGLGYSPSWGSEALRQAVASTTSSLRVDDVLVLSSPIEGLFLLSQAFPGEWIVLLPAYDALKNLPTRLKPWTLRAGDGDWELDFEQLESLVGPSTQLLVVNFPHNPTGYQPDLEEMERLVLWARSRGIRLFCDEMYRGLHLFESPQLPSVADLDPRAIVLGGLSKAHGLPGLRAGWLTSRDHSALEKLHDLKLYTSICAASPVDVLSTLALSHQELLLERNRRLVEANVLEAERFFERWSDRFVWRRPRAGSVALVELLAEPSAEEACYRWAREDGVVLLPATFLGFPDRYVRFGLGRDNFSQALEAFEEVLRRTLQRRAPRS